MYTESFVVGQKREIKDIFMRSSLLCYCHVIKISTKDKPKIFLAFKTFNENNKVSDKVLMF